MSGTAPPAPRRRPLRIAAGGPSTVLVVTADIAQRELCREVLARRGFTVAFAENGVQAVLSARETPPDLVLMDRDLPDGPGIEAIAWLRCNPALAAAPIVLVGGDTESPGDDGYPGADVVLRKPVSGAGLDGMLRKLQKRLAKRPVS